MQNARAFKKQRYLLLVVFLSILFFLGYKVKAFWYIDQEIVQHKAIGKLTTLYITVSTAGVTSPNVYKYYLYSANYSETQFIAELKNGYDAFLVTTDPNANIKTTEDSIYITVKGDIYNFKNTTRNASIYLNSSPY